MMKFLRNLSVDLKHYLPESLPFKSYLLQLKDILELDDLHCSIHSNCATRPNHSLVNQGAESMSK